MLAAALMLSGSASAQIAPPPRPIPLPPPIAPPPRPPTSPPSYFAPKNIVPVAPAPEQMPCTIARAQNNRNCPVAMCMAPPPCDDGSQPKIVQEIDEQSLHYGNCCLKLCNYKCEGGTGPCADFTWPPPGTQYCKSDAECIEGEKCEGCMASSCQCDPATGKRGACTDDCRFTCQGRFEPEYQYTHHCSVDNGGCAATETCKEEPMMCFNPPCPVSITCLAANGDAVMTYRGHVMPDGTPRPVVFAQFAPNGGEIVSLGNDGDSEFWMAENGAKVGELQSGEGGNPDMVAEIGFPWSKDGRRLAFAGGSPGGPGRLLAIVPNTVGQTGMGGYFGSIISMPSGVQVTSISWSDYRQGGDIMYMDRIATGTATGDILIWNPNGDPFSAEPTKPDSTCSGGNKGPLNSVHFASDSIHIGTGGQDGTACGYEAGMGSCTLLGACLSKPNALPIKQAYWSPDMTMVAGCAGNLVYVWLLGDGVLTHTFTGHLETVNSISWSPDSTKIASASNDKTVKIWTVTRSTTGQPLLQTFADHTDKVNWVDWSSQPQWLVSASDDGTAKVWEWTDKWVPPSPQSPAVPAAPAGCISTLQQLCPNSNSRECQSCVSQLGYLLSNAGCTEQDYYDYCMNSASCEVSLQKLGCDAAGQNLTTCFSCAAANEAALPQCDQGIVEAVCSALQPRPEACNDQLGKACGDFAGKGGACDACVEDNIPFLQKAGCDYNLTSAFCTGSVDTPTCERALDRACQNVFQKGSPCFTCLSKNQALFRDAACGNAQLQEYCTVPQAPSQDGPSEACRKALVSNCPDTGDAVTCLRCVSPKLSDLMQAGCTRPDAINYCQK